MMFISTRVCLEAGGRMLQFLLLLSILLKATAGLAVAQVPDARAPVRGGAEIEMIQQQQMNVQIIQLQQVNPGRQLPAELFESMIFQQDRSPDAARERMEMLLSNEIAEFDRTCALSPAQKVKLLLVGRGDIKRFFDRCEILKGKFVAPGQRDEDINEDINALQIILRSGLFHSDSLLHKALPNALSGEQFAQIDAMIRRRVQSRHEVAIKQAVAILEQGSRFSEAERQKFIAFLNSEIRPSPITGSGYDFYYIFGQLGRLPQEKVKPLLNEAQLLRLAKYQDTVRRLEPRLRKAGYFRDEDDENEKPDTPATASRK